MHLRRRRSFPGGNLSNGLFPPWLPTEFKVDVSRRGQIWVPRKPFF
jgi:hypothetical protein